MGGTTRPLNAARRVRRGLVVSVFALSCVALLSSTSNAVGAERRRITVAFIEAFDGVRGQDDWGDRVVGAMRAAANDLDIELQIYDSGHWPTETVARVEALLRGPHRPNYLIISIHRAIGVGLLEAAERAQVPVFVINAGLLEKERALYGGPRQHFEYWIGQMVPDDERAGYQLGNLLIDEALRRGKVDHDGRVSLLGMGGTPVDFASIERERGLRRAVEERSEARLLQFVGADWNMDVAQRKTRRLLQRYPEAGALWNANDAMAFGALQAMEELGRPRDDLPVGGMNWEPRALDGLKSGELVATVDGHMFEGAWALVLLYDYEHGQDFRRIRLEWFSPMLALTRHNVDDYRSLITQHADWDRLDFRAFSRTHHPELKDYRFSIEALRQQLEEYTPLQAPGEP